MSTPTGAGAKEVPSPSSLLSPTVVHFISGGIAGCLAKTFIAPLDRLKILSQVRAEISGIDKTNRLASFTGSFSVQPQFFFAKT